MQQTQRTETFNDTRYYNWKFTYDIEDNYFKPLVDKNNEIGTIIFYFRSRRQQ